MSRWLRVWGILFGAHFLGLLAVPRMTASGLRSGQLLAALLVAPAAELAVLALVAKLGGPSPQSSQT